MSITRSAARRTKSIISTMIRTRTLKNNNAKKNKMNIY